METKGKASKTHVLISIFFISHARIRTTSPKHTDTEIKGKPIDKAVQQH